MSSGREGERLAGGRQFGGTHGRVDPSSNGERRRRRGGANPYTSRAGGHAIQEPLLYPGPGR